MRKMSGRRVGVVMVGQWRKNLLPRCFRGVLWEAPRDCAPRMVALGFSGSLIPRFLCSALFKKGKKKTKKKVAIIKKRKRVDQGKLWIGGIGGHGGGAKGKTPGMARVLSRVPNQLPTIRGQ